MLPISSKDVVHFTPRRDLLAHLRDLHAGAHDAKTRNELQAAIDLVQTEIDAAPQPVYRLAVPSHLQRAAFRRDVLAAGAIFSGYKALYAALRADIEAIGPANLDEALEIIDAVEAAGNPADADAELRDRFTEIARIARGLGGRYAGVEGDFEFYLSVAPFIACRHFLMGWEGVKDAAGTDAPFIRRGNLTTEETLGHLGENEVREIGFKILNLMQPTKAMEKNSVSPSRSASSRTLSPTAKKKRPTARRGKSSANGTTATPA
ncbi:hypothetical protein [Azospirillum sp. BE72]|uniref:hypothetical protein n=1 Tax=Azospirillum sp. BE72 TaxID=2817776 RepID=UPI002857B2B7|nr:hypothetical protein [Azospirillum sp. BE72]MDR6770383.1 hypothetical protein [Azospirillum sp. BE72]